jgi:hypothetical protein
LSNGIRLNNNNANNNNANEENHIDELAQSIDNKIHQLLGMNAKPCPACKISIEKIDGCRHMTHDLQMGGCGHEFCWHCLKPWDKHGWNDGRRFDKFFCNPADLAQAGAHDVALWQQCVSHLSSLEDRRLIRYVRNRHVAAALIAVSVLAGCVFKIYKAVKR